MNNKRKRKRKRKLFTKKERIVLEKYENEAFVDMADANVLNNWASAGFVSFRFDLGTMKETAVLTDSGKAHLDECRRN